MKLRKMRKNSFVTGAFMATIGIFITKILGILYVIPFHAVIGESGGALYGYAYTIYLFFISISSAGIPLAISKITSEYLALGDYNAKERAFYLGKKIALILGVISFLILIIFAPILSNIIMGDLSGGNTKEDVTFVIRVISFAILVVPILSIYRGYFEGHKFMEPPSFSQVLEQIVRITIIIVGSYLVLDIFKLSLRDAVGVALLGATVGAISAYLYLINKKIKNKNKFQGKSRTALKITDKEIVQKIIYYAFPLIMIDLCKSMYNFIDTFTVVNGLVSNANYSVKEAETIVSMLSTWGSKFNMIITAIATGIVVSLIPNLTEAIVKDNKKDIESKINQSIGMCLFLTIPMTLGIAILSQPIWNLFYGSSSEGASLLSYYIFTGLFSSLFTVVITIIQVFKDTKTLAISLVGGVLIKLLFNTKLILSFYKMGLAPYYGVITATIFGLLFSSLFALLNLSINKKIHFEELLNNFIDILCGAILMGLVLVLLKFIIPVTSTSRIINILIIILYSIIGMIIYFTYTYKSKTIKKLFGNKINKFIQDKVH